MDAPARTRNYLFLQGMPTLFFAGLGRALRANGHAVHRINFTGGDRLYWPLRGAVDYRDTLQNWPAFLEGRLKQWRVTDIVLFGDWRPLHAAAIRVARLLGIAVHVFEEGYLRPHWVTLEQGGVNNNSALPRNADWYRAQAARLPEWQGETAIESSFLLRAVLDVTYHVTSLLTAWRYPGYRSHLPLNPFREYWGWIGRFRRRGRNARDTAASLGALAVHKGPIFVFPLQLDTDSQLRINSDFGRQSPAIRMVLESFARHAPQDAQLVIKEHPFDPQLDNWHGQIMAQADALGIASRIAYLTGGDLNVLIAHSRGLVTVNSTSGILALAQGAPVIALATPVYAMPGLTFQDGLDRFWREASPPDAVLFDAFRRVLAHRTQINGGFFSWQGLRHAVAGAVDRLEAVSLEPVLVAVPKAMPRPANSEPVLACTPGAAN